MDTKAEQGAAAQAVFTPGPWSVRRAICRNDHPDTSADVHGRDGQFVADCGCHEQATPNATLIAAAPDLYATLQALAHIARLIERTASLLPGQVGYVTPEAIYRPAEEVLAKAEGREVSHG